MKIISPKSSPGLWRKLKHTSIITFILIEEIFQQYNYQTNEQLIALAAPLITLDFTLQNKSTPILNVTLCVCVSDCVSESVCD